jgi:predicted DNA-binding antitoxin AbrB/MazE fold protein
MVSKATGDRIAMKKLKAVYAGGVFRPVELVDLAEDAHVTMLIFPAELPSDPRKVQGISGNDIEEFCGCLDADSAREMAAAVETAFETIEANDWR